MRCLRLLLSLRVQFIPWFVMKEELSQCPTSVLNWLAATVRTLQARVDQLESGCGGKRRISLEALVCSDGVDVAGLHQSALCILTSMRGAVSYPTTCDDETNTISLSGLNPHAVAFVREHMSHESSDYMDSKGDEYIDFQPNSKVEVEGAVLSKPHQFADEHVLEVPYQVADKKNVVKKLNQVADENVQSKPYQIAAHIHDARNATDSVRLTAASAEASTSSCSSLIGKSVHHNRRKATTQVSVRCNSEGNTLRDHGFHHDHRNATTQVPGRCNSEVSTLRVHGASRKDASHNHAAALAGVGDDGDTIDVHARELDGMPMPPFSANPESRLQVEASDSDDEYGVNDLVDGYDAYDTLETVRRSTLTSRFAKVVRDIPEMDVMDWVSDGTLARLTDSAKWQPMDSLLGTSSRGIIALHGEMVVGAVKEHVVGRLHRAATIGIIVDEAATVLSELWTAENLHEKNLRIEYDTVLAHLVNALTQRLR